MTPLRAYVYPGMGDSIHARGILPALMEEREVWLDTAWPDVFHDMPGLHVGHEGVPEWAPKMTIGYHPNHVKRCGSVLAAMTVDCHVSARDFRLPIPPDWELRARTLLEYWKPTRPLMIFRPVVQVVESTTDSSKSKLVRNPDIDAYRALFESIRERFFVVSVANCRPGVEWLLDPQIEPDIDRTHGELDFQTLAALFSLADLVFCHPGFAAVLSQAVGTPSVCVFGGFEDRRSFAAGAEYAPWLPIEPITPCPCWVPECKGDKTIDLFAGLTRLEQFVDGLGL